MLFSKTITRRRTRNPEQSFYIFTDINTILAVYHGYAYGSWILWNQNKKLWYV